MNSKTKKIVITAIVLSAAAVFWILYTSPPAAQQPGSSNTTETAQESILTPGRVAMIDLGAKECVPCKMMAPILADLKQEYDGRADIIFIDVWKNRNQAQKYGIRAIPTQIFFDENGEEVHRHMGFMDRETIIRNLTELGVEPPESHPDSR